MPQTAVAIARPQHAERILRAAVHVVQGVAEVAQKFGMHHKSEINKKRIVGSRRNNCEAATREIYEFAKGKAMPETRASWLSITNAEIGYGEDDAVIRQLSLKVKAGSIAALMGPSGCGKSTLLHAIGSLLPLRSGEIDIAGEAPEALRVQHAVGYVPQHPHLLPWRTVSENVELTATLAGIQDAKQLAEGALAAVELANARALYPHELSGGMVARAALARAIVHSPRMLLIDEAFGEADEPLRERLFLYVRQFVNRNGCFCFCVTHNALDACTQCDTIFVLRGHPANIVSTIQPKGLAPRAIDSTMSVEHLLAIREALR